MTTDQYIHVVYFSNATLNTHRFVQRLEVPNTRIPLMSVDAEKFVVNEEYVLIVPAYGDKNFTNFVPRQVKKFLNNPHNRALMRGVIGSGNRNFGLDYAISGNIISEKCGVPILGDFELMGTPDELETIKEQLRIENFAQQYALIS